MNDSTKDTLKELLSLALKAPKSIDWSQVDPELMKQLGVELKRILTSENALRIGQILFQIALAGRSALLGPIMIELVKLVGSKATNLSPEEKAKMQKLLGDMAMQTLLNKMSSRTPK